MKIILPAPAPIKQQKTAELPTIVQQIIPPEIIQETAQVTTQVISNDEPTVAKTKAVKKPTKPKE